jgi:hypothetical protein
MLWTENGPLDIFARFRATLAKRQKRMGGYYDLVSCFYCLSVWVSLLFSLFLADNILEIPAYTLILSGIASIIQELLYKRK